MGEIYIIMYIVIELNFLYVGFTSGRDNRGLTLLLLIFNKMTCIIDTDSKIFKLLDIIENYIQSSIGSTRCETGVLIKLVSLTKYIEKKLFHR